MTMTPATTPTYEELTRPLPAWSPQAWYYALVRLGLRVGAQFSHGLAIGRRHGFDSGVMLDHVYENVARGSGPFGRFVDRQYLNAVGWVGIRNRGRLLEQTIRNEIDRHRQPVRLADLACGGGRYILGALARSGASSTEAVLRDYEPVNIEKTRKNAAALGLAPRIEQADAFSDRDLARLGERDIVIVSGLHEIIDDDALVRNHFHQLATVLRPDGTLIVTIQPNHPQLKLIARTLRSHTGKPWAMRLRSEATTRAWLAEAGFTVLDVNMERTGIFGVVTARRNAD